MQFSLNEDCSQQASLSHTLISALECSAGGVLPHWELSVNKMPKFCLLDSEDMEAAEWSASGTDVVSCLILSLLAAQSFPCLADEATG